MAPTAGPESCAGCCEGAAVAGVEVGATEVGDAEAAVAGVPLDVAGEVLNAADEDDTAAESCHQYVSPSSYLVIPYYYLP